MTKHTKHDLFANIVHRPDVMAWHQDILNFNTLVAHRRMLLRDLRRLRRTIEQWSTPVQSHAERWNSVHIPSYAGSPDIVPIANGQSERQRRVNTERQGTAKQLRDIEARLVHTENQMHELQMRILTFEPKTAEDAGRMMSFMSGLSKIGHPVPPEYADDILQACADVVSSPSEPAPAAIVGL